jgi:AmmeMemoRadiSam system protein B
MPGTYLPPRRPPCGPAKPTSARHPARAVAPRLLAGGALDRALTAFATPLGEVAIDVDAVARLRGNPDFQGPPRAHDPEHCLEVELPFLQAVAPRASIVPVLVGEDTDRETSRRMARALAELLDPATAVVVSSDFTHHGSRYGYAPFAGDPQLGDTLLQVGGATAGRLAAVDPDGFWHQLDVSGDTVCGRRPLAVLGELDHALLARAR